MYFSLPVELTVRVANRVFDSFQTKALLGVCGFNSCSLNSVPSITPFSFYCTGNDKVSPKSICEIPEEL